MMLDPNTMLFSLPSVVHKIYNSTNDIHHIRLQMAAIEKYSFLLLVSHQFWMACIFCAVIFRCCQLGPSRGGPQRLTRREAHVEFEREPHSNTNSSSKQPLTGGGGGGGGGSSQATPTHTPGAHAPPPRKSTWFQLYNKTVKTRRKYMASPSQQKHSAGLSVPSAIFSDIPSPKISLANSSYPIVHHDPNMAAANKKQSSSSTPSPATAKPVAPPPKSFASQLSDDKPNIDDVVSIDEDSVVS